MISRRNFTKLSLLNFSLLFFSNNLFALNQKNILWKKIPKTGQKISPIGMGTWITFDVSATEQNIKKRAEILKVFFDNHGQMIDSSPMYGMAETIIGLSLQRIRNKNNLFSATKVWTPFDHHGKKQIKNSFKLWKQSELSLLQVHNLLSYEKHVETIKKYQNQKKIRYLGVTTSHGRRHEKLKEIMKNDNLDFVQFTYNILDDEAEKYLLPLAQEKKIAVIINRPFQGGHLFKYSNNKKIPKWTKEMGLKTWSEIYLKFIVSHPAVTCVIPATTQISHMHENMQSQYGKLFNEDQRKEVKKYFKKLV